MMRRYSGGLTFIVIFFIGTSYGLMCGYLLFSSPCASLQNTPTALPRDPSEESTSDVQADPQDQEEEYSSENVESDVQNGTFVKDVGSVAGEQKAKPRLLCWVMTCPENHEAKASHVKATWGKRCDTLLFMSSKQDESLPAIGLPVGGEGRSYLWGKTKRAFEYVYEHYAGQYDWVLKADDNTYAIPENLRYFLSSYNPNDPIYLGCILNSSGRKFASGGAGYILSKKAVEKLVKEGIPSKGCYDGDGGAEDIEMAICLKSLGVEPINSKDSLGRGRFFQFDPEHQLFEKDLMPSWLWPRGFEPKNAGLDCCSDTAVTFHEISPRQMYVMEYLLYHLRVDGVKHPAEETNTGAV